MFDVIQMLLAYLVIDIPRAVLAVAVAWLVLRGLDALADRVVLRHLGTSTFAIFLRRLPDDASAAALYYGARILAVCVLVGQLLG